MYLKCLDILGFKSFANKTKVQFSSGITAIVGPNGCGKTNILDALRWVLGEQKVTLLRGSKMEEVIFNGTRDMKPLGMSEVTLTLVNNRGVLPIEYTEVQVTRRLFRSGESEYLLNKVPCRLKDIHDLFFDTGVGAHSYSVIQHDMIDAVISDKAEERRLLFEEAAGITKYKQRKRAALRKLEATEQDLLRLRDIYAEVQTQVRSLNRQQKKAQRYQDVVEEIRNWELCLSATRIHQIDNEKREMRAEQDSLSDRRTEQETSLSSLTSQLEGDRREQLDLDRDLTEISNEVFEASEKAHSLEREISILVEKRSNAKNLIERNRNDIEGLKSRAAILREQVLQLEQNLEKERREHDDLQTKLIDAENAQAEADRKLLAFRSNKSEENQKLIELEGRLSSGKTEDDNLRRQQTELEENRTELERQTEINRQQSGQLGEQLQKLAGDIAGLNDKRTAAESRQGEVNREIERLIEHGEGLTLEASNVTAAIEACQARKNLLEDMIVHYEGYESGVVSLMEVRERWPGIAGTVAEKFVPVEGLEIAVEAALGNMAGFVICDNRKTAEDIVGYLKTESLGRVGILVPDSGTINPVVKRPEIDRPEFVGWLDGFVSTEENLRPLMQAVLARTAVFDAKSDPSEILERLPYGITAVSTEGILYGKNMIAGGSDDQFPLFRRREKVAEQEQLIEELNEKLTGINNEKSMTTASLAANRAESSSLVGELESLAEGIAGVQKNRDETDYQRRTLESELARIDKSRRDINDRLEKLRHRQYSLGLDCTELSTQKEHLIADITQTQTHLEQLETDASATLEHVSKLQIESVESRSQVEQTESKLSHIGELLQEIENSNTAKSSEIERAEQEINTSSERIEVLEAELKTAFNQRTLSTERQTRLRVTQSEIQQRIDSREGLLKQARSERENTGERIHQIEIRLNTLDSEIKTIRDRISEDYEVDIDSVEVVRPDENVSDDQARVQLAEKKEHLKKFGAVNLLALEEYRTASERETFLREQLEDLTGAKDDLQTTINKINRTARQMFNETFDIARENFKKLFIRLFTGGEADMFLVNPDDPLESDIQIIARPRGKKLLSITMMSGGERALTAIALLFSLYLVKPSPFCILDEIDAPLDDANCRRFLNIIGDFSKQTQFIIITHNKITMEMASNLYGVTMEQPGISKLVAVKFNDVVEDEQTGNLVIAAAQAQSEAVVPSPETAAEAMGEAETPDAVIQRLDSDFPTTDDPDIPL